MQNSKSRNCGEGKRRDDVRPMQLTQNRVLRLYRGIRGYHSWLQSEYVRLPIVVSRLNELQFLALVTKLRRPASELRGYFGALHHCVTLHFNNLLLNSTESQPEFRRFPLTIKGLYGVISQKAVL
jgi:hypothetical protein